FEELKGALQQLQGVERYLASVGELSGRLESALIEIKDIADEVATLEQSVYMDEGRLNVVNDRLSVLYGLQKKHRLETVADLIVLQQQLETKIQARSEERRVGNESRDCWSTHDWQNNG